MHESQMLQVCEAATDSRAALAARMAPLRAGKPAPWLEAGVKSGRFKLSEVRVDGKAVGVFWWWFSGANRALVVNAAGSLSSEDIFGPLVAGIERLGRELGAEEVQFQTSRRGLVQKAKSSGFVCEGVVMTKML